MRARVFFLMVLIAVSFAPSLAFGLELADEPPTQNGQLAEKATKAGVTEPAISFLLILGLSFIGLSRSLRGKRTSRSS